MPIRTSVLEGGRRAALSRIGQRRQVVIPKVIFDAMRLREGDFMEITVDGGCVSMKPKRLVDADELTPAEEQKVRVGLAQARAGRTRAWASVKNELGL